MALIRSGLVKLDYLKRLGTKDSYKAKFEALAAAIDNAPAVDAEPVRHGTWILVNPDKPEIPVYKCSECKHIGCVKEKTNFCACCGAKMD